MANEPNTIISLTYHEITKDPRVLKQARVLKNAGYDVNVLCEWLEGMPNEDDIDGIQITRFKWQATERIRPELMDQLSFLNRSYDELAKRFLPFAEVSKFLDETCAKLDEMFGPNALERAQSKHFKEATGIERVRRFFDYLYISRKLQSDYKLEGSQSNLSVGKAIHKERKEAKKEYWAHRRRLFQAVSLVYCANLPEITQADKVAAVHAHDIYCLPAGVLLSRQLNVPLVYDAHEYEPARATRMDAEAPELPEHIEDDCFPFVKRLITVSDGIGELYADRFDGPPPAIIMNAPEENVDEPSETGNARTKVKTVREMSGLSENDPLIVFTGGVQNTNRGLDKVLEALTDLPNVHLVALGPRIQSNDEWLRDCARNFNVEERLVLLPPVDARDVPSAISTADLSVCPIQDVSLSYRYSMPNKLFEAAFAKIPICVSDLPEMRRFVETLGIGRAMDQTDPKSIASAIQETLENPTKYIMSQTAEKKMLETYSWSAQAKKLLSLYEEIIGPPCDEQLSTL